MLKLIATSSLLLAVATMLPTASASVCPNGEVETTIDCGEGQIQCWVYDPSRPDLPWKGSSNTWPQCYSPIIDSNNLNGTYVCTDQLFLCPSNAPINCGGACYDKNASLTAQGCQNGYGFLADHNNGNAYPSIYTTTSNNVTTNQTYTMFPSTISRGCVTAKEAAEIAASGGGGGSASGSGSGSGAGGSGSGASGSGTGVNGSGAGGSAGKSQSSASTQTVSMMLGSLLAAALITIF